MLLIVGHRSPTVHLVVAIYTISDAIFYLDLNFVFPLDQLRLISCLLLGRVLSLVFHCYDQYIITVSNQEDPSFKKFAITVAHL